MIIYRAILRGKRVERRIVHVRKTGGFMPSSSSTPHPRVHSRISPGHLRFDNCGRLRATCRARESAVRLRTGRGADALVLCPPARRRLSARPVRAGAHAGARGARSTALSAAGAASCPQGRKNAPRTGRHGRAAAATSRSGREDSASFIKMIMFP